MDEDRADLERRDRGETVRMDEDELFSYAQPL
jgi:hypothetical protein